MREIVQIQVGQCGNAMGSKFWDVLCAEHEIDMNGVQCSSKREDDINTEKLNVFFSESRTKNYRPRCILTDLDCFTTDNIRATPGGNLIPPDNIIQGSGTAGNNWAKGHYGEGVEIVDSVLDRIRQVVEDCDLLQGFQMTHSLGGGTGSGLGSLLLEKVREEYPDRMLFSYPVFPSPKVSDTVVEPYNFILSLQRLTEYVDGVVCIDNEALYNTCTINNIPTPTYGDLNYLVALAMANVTASLRFPGQLNGDLRKLCHNLVPFPRLHFFYTSVAPTPIRSVHNITPPTVRDLVLTMLSPTTSLLCCDPRHGRFLTVAYVFRGHLSAKEVDEEVLNPMNKGSSYFVEWIPHNAKVCMCDVPPSGWRMGASILGSTTAIAEPFQRIYEQFNALYTRKAFLHWYTNNGVDQMEFSEAEGNVLDLIREYQQYQDATADDEDHPASVQQREAYVNGHLFNQ